MSIKIVLLESNVIDALLQNRTLTGMVILSYFVVIETGKVPVFVFMYYITSGHKYLVSNHNKIRLRG